MADTEKAPTGADSTAGEQVELPKTNDDPNAPDPNDADAATHASAPPAPDGGLIDQSQADQIDKEPATDPLADTDVNAELAPDADPDAGLVASISDLPTVPEADTLTQRDARAVQFPSTVGQPEVEVAERTADTTKASTPTHRKTFVLLQEQYDSRRFNHQPNINATRQFMLDYGLRPVGDVKFVGSEKHRDGVSVKLHYEGQAIPAVVATAPSVNHTVVAQAQ